MGRIAYQSRLPLVYAYPVRTGPFYMEYPRSQTNAAPEYRWCYVLFDENGNKVAMEWVQ